MLWVPALHLVLLTASQLLITAGLLTIIYWVVAAVAVLELLEVGLVPVVVEEAAAVMLRALKLLLKTEQVIHLASVGEVAEVQAQELAVMPMVVLVGEDLHQPHSVKLPMVEVLEAELLTQTLAVVVVVGAHQMEIMVVQEQEQPVALVVQILPTLEVLAAAHHITAGAVLLVLAVVL
jgi:hypothetical protein